jgi:hypothetical protein
MTLWMLIALLGLLKLPFVALMLWLPFRSDEAMNARGYPDSSEDDGGSKTFPGGNPHPRPPLPRRPRRGPHGAPSPPAPRRVRTTLARRGSRVRV